METNHYNTKIPLWMNLREMAVTMTLCLTNFSKEREKKTLQTLDIRNI